MTRNPATDLQRSLGAPARRLKRTEAQHAPDSRGRSRECAVLDGMIADVRRSESRTLLLRGEAGVGKTALLEYLVDSASDLHVVRAVGVESEMELDHVSLHQLCAPLLDRLERPRRHARVARLDHRAAEDHGTTYPSHRACRQRNRRHPCGDSGTAGLRV